MQTLDVTPFPTKRYRSYSVGAEQTVVVNVVGKSKEQYKE
jgi:hypothetical protein